MDMKELLTEFASAIDAEIGLLEKENREQAYELLSRQRAEGSTGTLYIFILADALRLPEDASGTLRVDGRDVSAMVVSQEGNRIWLLLESVDPLPDYIPSARLVVNETDLLKRLKEQIEALRSRSEFGLGTKVFGFEPSVTGSAEPTVKAAERLDKQGLDEQGKKVVQQCLGSEVTFVWGPPGTGKTFTIAALVACLAEIGETVLVTSHTHAAVEQALSELVKEPTEGGREGFLYGSPLIEKGRIIKVGKLRQGSKIPTSVQLDRYLENMAKKREETVRILEGEHELASRRLEHTKAKLAPWLEMKQAELIHEKALDTRERAVSARDAAVTGVTRAKIVADQREAARVKAEHSFFIGRRGRVQRALEALAAARQALTLAQAVAGEAEVGAIKAKRMLDGAAARLMQAREATKGLTSSEELEKEAINAQERITMLESQIKAISGAAEGDAKQLVQNAVAIFATLTKLYVDRNLLADMKWDTVVVDEVSMAMPPLLAYAASRAKKRVVLAGDMYQLPPVVHSKQNSAGEILGKDIFKLRGITDIIDRRLPHPQVARLITQRRMHPDIVAGAKALIPSYSDLEDNPVVMKRPKKSFIAATLTDRALAVIDISDLNPWSGKMPGNLSRFNFISAQAAVELSALYAAQIPEPNKEDVPPIGIITPYAAQRRYLSKLVQMFGLERWVTAGTVHTFQGNECDVVIFDSVVGEPHWTSRFTNPVDLRETCRDLNVAVTRAQYQFVFVGDTIGLANTQKQARAMGNSCLSLTSVQ